MADPTILIAFTAGLVSFLAPCVLPLIPGFLAYLGGIALDNNVSLVRARFATFHASIFFVIGFMLVFAALGVVLSGALSSIGPEARTFVARAGGVVVIFFGFYVMGLVKLSFLERARRVSVRRKFSSRSLASFVFGAAFAAGWTPCVGAALGAILGLAAVVPGKAFFLLLAYATGIGVPFLVVGFFAASIERYLNKNFSWIQYVNILFGGVLVWFGVMALTQNLSVCGGTPWGLPF